MPFISSKACYEDDLLIFDNIVYFSGLMDNCMKNTIKSKLIVWCGGGGGGGFSTGFGLQRLKITS